MTATRERPDGTRATALLWALRLIGTSSLLALVFVVAPYSWMNSIHQDLGLGVLPDQPIVGYLARSTSAFYAMFGGLMLLLSTDLVHYRKLIAYVGGATATFGLALLLIDWQEGLPAWWTFWEGPFVLAFGLLLLWLNRGHGGDAA